MIIFMQDKIRDATEDEKVYVRTLAQYAIDKTIETDGVSFYWAEPGSKARYSTQYPKKGGE